MEKYPSISTYNLDNFPLYTYEKLDGSNIRVEVDKNKYRFGTRTEIIDKDSIFGSKVIPLFMDTIEPKIKHYFIQKVTLFLEFYGPNSFAGQHEWSDNFELKLIDIHEYKKGFLTPTEYNTVVAITEVPSARYLGSFIWNSYVIGFVKNNTFPGQSFEGIVGKRVEKNKIIRTKLKSDVWIEKLKLIYGEKAESMM